MLRFCPTYGPDGKSFNNPRQALNFFLFDMHTCELVRCFEYCPAASHRDRCLDCAVEYFLFRFDNAYVCLSPLEQTLSQLTS